MNRRFLVARRLCDLVFDRCWLSSAVIITLKVERCVSDEWRMISMTHESIKLLSQHQNCVVAKTSLPVNHHIILQCISGNKDVCLPFSHSQSSCSHHEQSQMLRDMSGNFYWTHWETKVKLLSTMPKCFFSWQLVAAHSREIGKKESLTPVRRSARLQKSTSQLSSSTSITLDKEVLSSVLIQIRSLTSVEAFAQFISLDQTFPFRSKATAKWRAWTESNRWGQSIESFAFAESEETHTKTTTSLSCKSHCWGRCTHRSLPLQQEQRRQLDSTLNRRRKLIRRKFRGRQQHE